MVFSWNNQYILMFAKDVVLCLLIQNTIENDEFIAICLCPHPITLQGRTRRLCALKRSVRNTLAWPFVIVVGAVSNVNV